MPPSIGKPPKPAFCNTLAPAWKRLSTVSHTQPALSWRESFWGIVFVSAAPEMEPHSTQTRVRSVDSSPICGLLENLYTANDSDQADGRQDQEILPDDRFGNAALMEDY